MSGTAWPGWSASSGYSRRRDSPPPDRRRRARARPRGGDPALVRDALAGRADPGGRTRRVDRRGASVRRGAAALRRDPRPHRRRGRVRGRGPSTAGAASRSDPAREPPWLADDRRAARGRGLRRARGARRHRDRSARPRRRARRPAERVGRHRRRRPGPSPRWHAADRRRCDCGSNRSPRSNMRSWRACRPSTRPTAPSA